MRPVPPVSQRPYATASAHETPSTGVSAMSRLRSHSAGAPTPSGAPPPGGGCCVSSTNSAYSPTRTGRRAMAKTFTCSVRGGSPSSASPAGTTTTSGSTIVGTLLTRAGEYALGGVRTRETQLTPAADVAKTPRCELMAMINHGYPAIWTARLVATTQMQLAAVEPVNV